MIYQYLRLIFLFLFLSFFVFSSHSVPFQSEKIAISAASPEAVKAGLEIYQRGGNVVDVAVVVALTQAVTAPYYASLGGGGFSLIKMGSASPIALDFREKAPLKITSDFFKNNSSTRTGSAVGTPGIPAGLFRMHERFGSLTWKYLFKRPLLLSKKGFRVSGKWVENTKKSVDHFNSSARDTFLKKNGHFYAPASKMRQVQLHEALKLFKDKKLKGFYNSPVSWDIVKTVQKNGGLLTKKDFLSYKVRWLNPLISQYKDYKIYLMPPPSSAGVILASAFYLLEKLENKFKKVKNLSADEFHYLGEILSRSFRGRTYLADPDFYLNPMSVLLSEKHLNIQAKSIKTHSRKLFPLKIKKDLKKEAPETTHISVMDHKGNAVSMTLTVNGIFGSGLASNKYRIILNNQMDDFTTKKGQKNMFSLTQGVGNIVEPGKRPLSSMAPTLVEKDDQIIISIGGVGGPRIISAVFQSLYRMLYRQLDIEKAIFSPRVHHQFSPHILYTDGLQHEVIKSLRSKWHKTKNEKVGLSFGVEKDLDTGFLKAAHDFRSEGYSSGL